jgi:hypothetical protein
MNRKFHDDYSTTTGSNPAPIRKKLIAPFQDAQSKQQSAVIQACPSIAAPARLEDGRKLTAMVSDYLSFVDERLEEVQPSCPVQVQPALSTGRRPHGCRRSLLHAELHGDTSALHQDPPQDNEGEGPGVF